MYRDDNITHTHTIYIYICYVSPCVSSMFAPVSPMKNARLTAGTQGERPGRRGAPAGDPFVHGGFDGGKNHGKNMGKSS